MANFKGIESTVEVPRIHGQAAANQLGERAALAAQPLFESFDPQTQGGLVVLPTGQIAEMHHPSWAQPDKQAPEDRITLLPIQHVSTEEGDRFVWRSERVWDPLEPTLGSESEIEVRQRGAKYAIVQDGTRLHYPDGSSEPIKDAGFDPEGFKQTVEFGTNVAVGFAQHRRHFITEAARVERWLVQHDLESPYLSLLADTAEPSDLTEHWWVRLMNSKMPSMLEFGCMSTQIHVQLADIESGIHALTKYQGVQALFGLLTAAAPLRNGSFETALVDHYHDGHRTISGVPVLPEDDLIRHQDTAHTTPYDWRELSRVLGSQSAGAFVKAIPVTVDAFLREADRQLRNGDTVSAVRTLGWHTDRLRLDQGTIEICNLGSAGGNVHKSLAVQEVVIKYMVALQEEYRKGSNMAAWNAEYERAIEVGQVNNYLVGLSGKETRLIGQDGTPVTPAEMLDQVCDFIARHSPLPVSSAAYKELQNTLMAPPESTEFTTAEQVFEYFIQRGSRMTATEVLRTAHAVEPDLSMELLLSWYALIRREHLFVEEALMHAREQ